MQPRLRSLYRYTMCKLIAKPVARTVGASSELASRRLLSGIDRLAAQPPLRESRSGFKRFDAPPPCVSESLGACWKNSQRGFEEREPSVLVCLPTPAQPVSQQSVLTPR